MNPSRSSHQSLFQFLLVTIFFISLGGESGWAQARRLSSRSAVVADERLAVLRVAPQFSAPFLRRIGRGRIVTLLETQRSSDGAVFYRVAVTRRTRGWLQREAVVVPSRAGDDARLLALIKASRDFDRLARARIFLDVFRRSRHRPAVLLIFGEAAEKAAAKLSHDAARQLDPEDLSADASLVSYFLNYRGLDRYRRQGIVFTFDPRTRQFHYDGAAWRELNRRYRGSAEASVIRQRN
ncbi:MAG: hypothetical protein WAL47_14350 [Pyrinomonadaceae bacterium]